MRPFFRCGQRTLVAAGLFAAGLVALAAPAAAAAVDVAAAPKFDSGDTAWMLTSVALVLMMTIPGLALFYGGMVRKMNVLSTVMQSFAVTCLVTVLWTVVGYSLAFTTGSPVLGGLSRFLLFGMTMRSVNGLAPTIPESVYMCFQMTFAIITPALICGAIADRMKFSALLWFIGLWSLFVYAPIAHWVWGADGFLNGAGVLDFAGGTVVHINSGVAGLMAALVLGKRRGYGTEPMAPHNLVFSVIGASLLWVGWFGFNAGSATAANANAGMAMTVTQIATATAALSWMGRVEHQGEAERLGDHLGGGRWAGRDHPGLGLCRSARRAAHRPRRRNRLLLEHQRPQACDRLRRQPRCLWRARHRRRARRDPDRRPCRRLGRRPRQERPH